MAGTNNFLVFNEANNPTSTMSDADYLADLYRLNGLIPMIADPNAHNKMFRQWSIMVTALANIIASMNYNASDSDLTDLTDNLKSAIEDVAEAKVDSRISTLENWKDDITATTTEINYLSGADSNIQQQINSISGSLATPFPAWIKNTPYVVGDICICTGFDSYKYLECVVAGTTATTPPVNANVGQLITDNTVKWLVCDFRDSAPVGAFRQEIALRPGWLKLNGATINVADYPRLIDWLIANNRLEPYTLNPEDTKFYYADSNNTTVRLANFENLFIENRATNPLKKINAGLPNISANWYGSLLTTDSNTQPTLGGAAYVGETGTTNKASQTPATNRGWGPLSFRASLSNSIYGSSNTVQPPAVSLIPVIKY